MVTDCQDSLDKNRGRIYSMTAAQHPVGLSFKRFVETKVDVGEVWLEEPLLRVTERHDHNEEEYAWHGELGFSVGKNITRVADRPPALPLPRPPLLQAPDKWIRIKS